VRRIDFRTGTGFSRHLGISRRPWFDGMDWQNKHFNQEIVLQAPVEAVAEAARRFSGQSLPDWSIDATPEGFDASGRSGLHHAVAHFTISPVATGTKIAVELLVRRKHAIGFMLFDVGYFDSLVQKWLWTIWKLLADVHADPNAHAAVAPHGTTAPNAAVGARVVVMDAYGKSYLGVVRAVSAQGVLVAYDEGDERWVPATAAHVVARRDDLPG
jgi:hypothetical protein